MSKAATPLVEVGFERVAEPAEQHLLDAGGGALCVDLDGAAVLQTNRRDQVIPIKMGWQLGYHRPFPRKACSPSAFGFYGAYGSGAFADPDRGLAVGLTGQEAKDLPMLKLIKPIMEAASKGNR